MIEFTVGGETYKLAPCGREHIAECRQAFIESRGNPIEAIKDQLSGLSEELQKELVRQAYDEFRNGPPDAAFFDWIDSLRGMHYTFWVMLRKHHPEITVERAGKLVDAAMAEGLDKNEALKKLQQTRDDASES